VALATLGVYWLTALASGRQAIGARDSGDDLFETGTMCLILGCLLLLSTCLRHPSPWMLGAFFVVMHVGAATAYSLIFDLTMVNMATVIGASLIVACMSIAVVRHAAKDGTQTSAACD
jgi:uncharacterized membrane protein AbrB (regulator of aidB expression)